MYKLPNRWRPSGLRMKELKPGLDLPTWFLDGIKSVDTNLYFVWHPYRVMYEGTVMNQYSGTIEESRYVIGAAGAEEVWGYVLTDNERRPIPEEKWHCWRLNDNGWSHIFDVKYPKHPKYLKQLLDRLHLQCRLTEKYGWRAYVKHMREEREKMHDADMAAEDQLWQDTQKENSWLMDKAMDNFKSGKVMPTRPQRDVIVSFPGQKNRSKMTRDITDEEGGLILPDEYKKDE